MKAKWYKEEVTVNKKNNPPATALGDPLKWSCRLSR